MLPVRMKLRRLLLRRTPFAAGSQIVYCVLAGNWSAFCLCLEILPEWQKNFNTIYCWDGSIVTIESFWSDLCWKLRAKCQYSDFKYLARWKIPGELCIAKMTQRIMWLLRTGQWEIKLKPFTWREESIWIVVDSCLLVLPCSVIKVNWKQ